MSQKFVHLHNHSEYSLLDSLNKIQQIVDKTVELGMDAIAITDHGVMYGAFQFFLKCKAKGVKPIIGMEAYVAKNSHLDRETSNDIDKAHLTILAKNLIGYRNIVKLTTISHLEGFHYKPRIDFDLLKSHHEGLIVLSGCRESSIMQHLANDEYESAKKIAQKYQKLFGEDYYLEIQRSTLDAQETSRNNQLIKLSRELGIALVATNDIHYLVKEDSYAHEVLLCIQSQHSIYEKNRPITMIDTPEYYLKSPEEMINLFLDLPEAIKSTVEIANKCDLEIPYGNWVLPNFPLPKNKTSEEYLRDIIEERRTERLDDTNEIKARLEYELEIICSKGYATYFLVVADCVNWAKDQGIGVGPGRGSVGGSLVAYVMRITDVNPLLYNLPFERFLNPERPTPPDIDLDFADIRRGEVIDYITHKYGKEKVAQIITFGRMEARMAVRDVNRALGFSYSHGDRIAKLIPQGKQGFAMSIDRAIEESADLKTVYEQEEDVKSVIDVARRLEGVSRHASVHAAGLIVADSDLTNYVPLQRESKGDAIITQYDMYSLDVNAAPDGAAMGLLKIDILGLRNLTILEQAIKYVKVTLGINITLYEIPLDDKKTYDLISSGKNIGVFQLESKGMQRLAKDLQPNKISDITAMVALFRPGPMDLIPQFVEGKKDATKITYLHPHLENVLRETYGVLVYQEQIMDIAVTMANFTKSQADILRMAVGKKKKSLMEKVKKDFIEGAIKAGYPKKVPEEIFVFIEKFAAYGFNKAHAAAYATIAYWTAYMKANYPVQFMTALLTAELQGASGSDREQKMFTCLEECSHLNIKVLQPHINKSHESFYIEDNNIRFGLSALKGVGDAALETIIKAREKDGDFQGLRDFMWRVELQKVNKRVMETLIKSGAFDDFGNRSALLEYYQSLVVELSSKKGKEEIGQFGLFLETKVEHLDNLPNVVAPTEGQIVKMEKEAIGFSIGRNPLADYEEIIKKKITNRIGRLESTDTGKTQILAGIIASLKKITTKKSGMEMAFITLYDQTGTIEGVVFPKIWEQLSKVFIEGNPIIVKGKLEEKDEAFSLIIDQAVDLDKK